MEHHSSIQQQKTARCRTREKERENKSNYRMLPGRKVERIIDSRFGFPGVYFRITDGDIRLLVTLNSSGPNTRLSLRIEKCYSSPNQFDAY